jgi:lipopolysaccharide export system permease protein
MFILIDLFENLDKFIDKSLKINLVFLYYLYFVPEILKLIVPVAMLLASLFTVSRFINYSELTAMKSAGISIYRYLLPIMIFGLSITLFSIYFNGWVVPGTNRLKIELERTYLGRHQLISTISNLYIQDNHERFVTIGLYDKSNQVCNFVSIQIFNKDSINKLEYRYDSKQMIWDSVKKDWKLTDLYIRKFSSFDSEKLNFYPSIYISEIEGVKKLNIDPDLIIKKQLKPEELNLSEFGEFIDNLEKSGQDTAKAKVDYYSIISFPFSSLVTIIFGVSVSSNKRKGGAALQFGISILVSFIYLGFVKISQIFGYNGDVPALLTAWLANILFFLISAINFIRLNRG